MATKTKARAGITLQANELRAALAAVGAAVATRSPKPVLTNVRIGDGLMSATDLEVRIDTTLDYHGDPLLLPHSRLVAILSASVGGEVTLEPKGTSCIVRIGRGEWTLPTEDAAEFPAWEPTGLKPVTRLPADEFVRAVRAVEHSTDTESSRYALGAVLVDVKDGVVNFVATDGRRLSVAECEHDLAVDDGQTLVPSRVMSMLARLAGTVGEESVQLEADANTMKAEIGSHTVTAKLVAGRFPAWRDVVPSDGPEPTTVTGSELLSATRAAAIVASEASRGVDYTFTAEGLHLHGRSSELGESSVTCGIVEFGHACTVKLDPVFVREWLQGLPADGEPTVSVQAKDKGSAVVMRADNFTGVIMPLDAES
jgi:DNA polymerase-3 subunit beta